MKQVLRRAASLAVAVLACLPLLVTLSAARADSVPYTDPHATGYIGLCDQHGNPVTHGSIHDRPFVWLSVSSSPAAVDYDVPGKTATLFAFQPRQNVDPGLWEGSQMTAASWYTNGAHPMVAASSDAATLAQVLANYPTKLDGLVQLRIYVGGPGIGIHGQTYPATDIQVSGDSWSVVRGGNPDCNAGYAVSVLVGPKPTSSATTSPLPGAPGGPGGSGQASGASGTPGGASGSATGAQGSKVTGGAQPGGGSGTAPATATVAIKRAAGGGGGTAAIVAVLIAIVVLAGVGLLVVKSRQRKASELTNS